MRQSRNREFFAYVLPSVLAFALSGVYTIVDGLFVGRSLGDAGLRRSRWAIRCLRSFRRSERESVL